MIRIRRVYDPVEADDGYRVLVDRLWPRGVKKADARIDEWMKDVAPSPALRRWFGHAPERWTAFQRKYKEELRNKTDLLGVLRARERKAKRVTLLYGAQDREKNHAVVLLSEVRKR